MGWAGPAVVREQRVVSRVSVGHRGEVRREREEGWHRGQERVIWRGFLSGPVTIIDDNVLTMHSCGEHLLICEGSGPSLCSGASSGGVAGLSQESGVSSACYRRWEQRCYHATKKLFSAFF